MTAGRQQLVNKLKREQMFKKGDFVIGLSPREGQSVPYTTTSETNICVIGKNPSSTHLSLHMVTPIIGVTRDTVLTVKHSKDAMGMDVDINCFIKVPLTEKNTIDFEELLKIIYERRPDLKPLSIPMGYKVPENFTMTGQTVIDGDKRFTINGSLMSGSGISCGLALLHPFETFLRTFSTADNVSAKPAKLVSYVCSVVEGEPIQGINSEFVLTPVTFAKVFKQYLKNADKVHTVLSIPTKYIEQISGYTYEQLFAHLDYVAVTGRNWNSGNDIVTIIINNDRKYPWK